MSYVEPGVYSKTVSNATVTGTGAPKLIPLLIGSGDRFSTVAEVITRSSNTCDTVGNNMKSILSVGFSSSKADFVLGTDYVIDPTDNKNIRWMKSYYNETVPTHYEKCTSTTAGALEVIDDITPAHYEKKSSGTAGVLEVIADVTPAHYEKCSDSTEGALEVVSDETVTTSGQVTISNVAQYDDTIIVGNYVIWVEETTNTTDSQHIILSDVTPCDDVVAVGDYVVWVEEVSNTPTSTQVLLSTTKLDNVEAGDYVVLVTTQTNAQKYNISNETLDALKEPAEGDSYYVNYAYEAGDDKYELKLITDYSQLSSIGSNFKVDGSINNLHVAASIMWEAGCTEFYVRQVKPTVTTTDDVETETITATNYQEALEKDVKFVEDIWRIVPVDVSDSINAVIESHVRTCSDYYERKERSAFFVKEGSDAYETAQQVVDGVGGMAQSKGNRRLTYVYPAKATKELSDGLVHELGGQFIAAMQAGRESATSIQQSLTRDTTSIFKKLIGVKMTRKELNNLAEKGVTIFEQPRGESTNIICRHSLTTDMSSVQSKENSILAIEDYTSKYQRRVLDAYIGKYNITVDTISRVGGSVNAAFSDLVKSEVIISGALSEIKQDKDNPDTLIVTVRIEVPYPCNYIFLTIYVD